MPAKERTRLFREISTQVLYRGAKMCNFVEYKEKKIVYRRYGTFTNEISNRK